MSDTAAGLQATQDRHEGITTLLRGEGQAAWWKPIDCTAAGLVMGFTLEERDTHNILYAFILALWGNQISTSRKRAGTEQFKVPPNCIRKCSGVGIALSVLIK